MKTPAFEVHSQKHLIMPLRLPRICMKADMILIGYREVRI